MVIIALKSARTENRIFSILFLNAYYSYEFAVKTSFLHFTPPLLLTFVYRASFARLKLTLVSTLICSIDHA